MNFTVYTISVNDFINMFLFRLNFSLTWMIHESRWLRMRGTGHVAVVLHRKCPGAKQMQPDRLACKVKNAGIKKGYVAGMVNVVLVRKLVIRLIGKKIDGSAGIIYE